MPHTKHTLRYISTKRGFMKILIATDGMDIGGAETHVFTLINELKRRGIDVTLISAGGPYADILEMGSLLLRGAFMHLTPLFSRMSA